MEASQLNVPATDRWVYKAYLRSMVLIISPHSLEAPTNTLQQLLDKKHSSSLLPSSPIKHLTLIPKQHVVYD